MTTAARDPVAEALSTGHAPLAPPAFERHGDEFLLRWNEHAVQLALTGVRENGDGIQAELAVQCAGAEVHWGRLNLVSTSEREGVIKKLLAASDPGVPWRPILERACRLTTQALREGAPTVLLRPRQSPGPRFLIEPILPAGETAIIFGDGGAGKGFAALGLSLAAITSGALPGGIRAAQRTRVLYLDWESVREELEERLYLLSRGLGCGSEGLHYRRMSGILADQAPALRAEVSRLGIGLVIVDSLAPAAGPEPEGADAATRIMDALRSLGDVSRLVIAHMSHVSAQQKAGGSRPFGSVFYWNLARSVWELRRSEDEGDDLVVGLYHRKANRGRLHPPIGLRFSFGDDAITLHRADLGEAPDLLARATLTQRIRTVLAAGTRSSEEICEALGAPEDSVRRTLRRLATKGMVVRLPGDDGVVRWGLGL